MLKLAFYVNSTKSLLSFTTLPLRWRQLPTCILNPRNAAAKERGLEQTESEVTIYSLYRSPPTRTCMRLPQAAPDFLDLWVMRLADYSSLHC